MGHRGHIAVGVVGIGLDNGLVAIRVDDGAAQTVVVLARLDQAGFGVRVCARPIAIGCLMDQLLEITDGVILILLGVVSHRLAIMGVLKIHAKLVVPGGLRPSKLADMLAAFGIDQAIEGIIDVVAVWLDDLTIEVNRLLGIVADGGNVAGRIIGVEEVLQPFLAAQRLQVSEPEGERVVFVGRPDAVAVVDQRALALGVVIDVGDEGRGDRRAAQVDLDPLQQVGFVEAGAITLLSGAVSSVGRLSAS